MAVLQNAKCKTNADGVFNLFEQFGNLHPTVMEFAVLCQRIFFFFDSEAFVLFAFALFEKDSGTLPKTIGNCLKLY